MRFGLDAAASDVDKKTNELFEIYQRLKKLYDISYIEDPFDEDDLKNFKKLTKEIGDVIIIAGDDLTVTNVAKMKEVVKAEAVNGVIIKPNQIGTLTETFQAIEFAEKSGWKVVVSHRSGETDDDFIANLAYAVGAYDLKLGAPVCGERSAKYDRLLEIVA